MTRKGYNKQGDAVSQGHKNDNQAFHQAISKSK